MTCWVCAFAAAMAGLAFTARAQTPGAAPAPPVVAAEPWTDPLGRSTPRGTLRGFIEAARGGDTQRAARYLNSRPWDPEDLAQRLFVVLDARLPPRLLRVSDTQSGSDPSMPDREIVATIQGQTRSAEVILERLHRAGEPGAIWLFSRESVMAVTAQYDEIVNSRWSGLVPEFLVRTRVGGWRLIDVLAILLGLPVLYLATIFINRTLTPLIGLGFRAAGSPRKSVLPASARLLLVVIAAKWFVAALPLSFTVRQVWSAIAALLIIGTIARLLMLLSAELERHVVERVAPAQVGAAASLLRLMRRGADVLILFAAVIVALFHFGINPTPALAGLGVGGIAVALAAQKTLENVIAGASLIFDQAVRVGDFLKVGDVQGTVDHIGLRSTRIRTLDRTMVSIPNGQIANLSLETFSARDKFWFHHEIGLVYETTPEQLRQILEATRALLVGHPLAEVPSVRVRFIRLGAFSLDVEVFAYVQARDWNHFLEVQEQLLFAITAIVSDAGTSIAFPSQTTYVANNPVGSLPVH